VPIPVDVLRVVKCPLCVRRWIIKDRYRFATVNGIRPRVCGREGHGVSAQRAVREGQIKHILLEVANVYNANRHLRSEFALHRRGKCVKKRHPQIVIDDAVYPSALAEKDFCSIKGCIAGNRNGRGDCIQEGSGRLAVCVGRYQARVPCPVVGIGVYRGRVVIRNVELSQHVDIVHAIRTPDDRLAAAGQIVSDSDSGGDTVPIDITLVWEFAADRKRTARLLFLIVVETIMIESSPVVKCHPAGYTESATARPSPPPAERTNSVLPFIAKSIRPSP